MALLNQLGEHSLDTYDPPAGRDAHPPGVVIENPRRVPPLPAGAVSRPRLLTRLARAQHTPLVLVVAPAGWGKTTLLTQWAHVERRPVAWLSIEPRHNDPAALCADVARLLDGIGARPVAALSPTGPVLELGTSNETEPRRPIDARLSESVLVLDDVHLLHEPDAVELLELLASHV